MSSMDAAAFTCWGAVESVKAALGGFWTPITGRWGYRQGARSETGVMVFWDMPNADHFHVSMMGQALEHHRNRWLSSRESEVSSTRPEKGEVGAEGPEVEPSEFGYVYECQDDIDAWSKEFVRQVREWGGRFSRIDLAVDAREGAAELLDIDRIVHHISTRQFLGRFRPESCVELKNLGQEGHTLYIGSPTSETRIRVYDKAAERSAKLGLRVNPWMRIELQARDSRAQAAAEVVGERGASSAMAILRSLIDFTDGSDDWHRERLPVCSWWLELERLAGECGPVRLARRVVVASFERLERFVRSVGPSFATWLAAVGGDLETLHEWVASGSSRMREHHRRILAEVDATRRVLAQGSGVA